jgi:hypothetical protein
MEARGLAVIIFIMIATDFHGPARPVGRKQASNRPTPARSSGRLAPSLL